MTFPRVALSLNRTVTTKPTEQPPAAEEPGDGSRTLRVIGVIALVACCAAALVYGAAFQRVTVYVEQQAAAAQAQPALAPQFPGVFEDEFKPSPPPTAAGELVATERSEPYVINLVATGGLKRLDTGQLQEVVGSALCPT